MILHDDEPLGYDVRLSSQLLRTCQSLHRQSKAILYGTNTLILEVESSQDLRELISFRVPAMDIDVDIGGQCLTLLRREVNGASINFQRKLNAWSIRPIFDEVTSRLVTYYSWIKGEYDGFFVADAPSRYGSFFQEYAVIEQFGSFQLDLLTTSHDSDDDDDAFDDVLVQHFFGLRLLQDLLEQKTVLINFDSDNLSDNMDKFDAISYVQLCRILRCKAINFRLTGRMASMADVRHFVKKTKESIENGEPSHDSWNTVRDLRCEVFKKLDTYRPFLRLRQLEEIANDEFRLLHFRAKWYSKAICEEQILSALQRIEEQLPLCFQGQFALDTGQRRVLVTEIRQYFRSLIIAYECKRESDPLLKDIENCCNECKCVSKLLGSKCILESCRHGCTR